MRAILTLILLVCAMTQPGRAQDWDKIMAEAAWDWRPGDLIFINGISTFDDMIRQAEGGDWASVGVMRPASGDPRVVFVDQAEGVTERILYEITDTRAPTEYQVYRIKAAEEQGLGALTNYLLLSAYGSPFDPLMLFGNGKFYGAELAYEAALSEGHVLGQPRRLAELTKMDGPLAQALLSGGGHPYCVAALSDADCWAELQNIAVVTPGVLLASGALEQVYP